MLSKIQKKLVQKFNFSQNKKLLLASYLNLAVPIIFAVVMFGLFVSLRIDTTKTGYIQSVSHNKSTSKPKVKRAKNSPSVAVIPAVDKPAPTTTQPNIPAPTPVTEFAVTRAGTPKPEPVVTPAPSSSVSGLSPTTSTPTPIATAPTTSAPTPVATVPATPQTPTPTITTGYLSTNWSGYLATDANFTSVSATWVVTSPTGNNISTSADSTWIGIGGVTSGDLIQAGTQNIVSTSGQVSTSAFYELLPVSSQPVSGVTVSPGDSITASIVEVSSEQWTITITDNTDEESSTTTVTYSSSLSSAEWIEEDPSYSSRRQVPFDNFNEASFTDALTVANGSTVDLAESTAQPVSMVNSSDQTIAEPSVVGADGASFNVIP